MKITVRRLRTAYELRRLVPLFVEHIDLTAEDQFRLYARLLAEYPDNTLGLVAYAADNTIAGFAISHVEHNRDFVFVDIAYVNNKIDGTKNLLRLFLHKICSWGITHGRSTVRMATARNARAFERKLRFKQVYTVMEYQIPQDLAEIINGQRIKQTVDNIDVNVVATQVSEQIVGSDTPRIESGSNEV
jgi:hypothetical protein